LQNGADFAEIARKLSDDKRSAMQDGEMPWFSAGRMIPEFSTPAFALENTGDMTPPVETPFGFHIIKKLDHRPVPSFEEAREQIEERVRRDPARSNSSQKAFVEKLKKEYNFEANSANLEKLKTNENPSEELLLFSIDNKDFHLNDFNAFLKKNGIENSNSLGHYNDWITHEIIQLEDSKLEKKHPEFRYLMKEYHDGILLFNIMEEKIWGFASKDTAGLQKFYKKNKGIHQWGERFKGLIITCKSQETRQEAEKYFAAGMTATEVEDLLNESEKQVEIEGGAWEEGANDVIDYYVWNGKKTTSFNPELTFIRGDKIPPEPKTLEEARGLYISDYQNHLEKEWLKKLRKKYKIKVNKKVLKSVPHV